MNTARHVVGVLILVGVPPAVLAWYAIHPFAAFWRRFGAAGTYAVLALPWAACIVALYRGRELLLGPDLGTSKAAIALGVVCVAAGAVIARQRRKHLTFRILAGVPELARGADRGTLLTEGIYGRIRHPRYVEFLLIVLGYTLFSNHAYLYAWWALFVVGIYFIVVLEERELAERFGAAYEAYARKVPRFVPRHRDRTPARS